MAKQVAKCASDVLVRKNHVPLYVAAPLSSIDFSIPSGDCIPIEKRGPEEVTHIFDCHIATEGVNVRNVAFDVTPAKYVTGIITEKTASDTDVIIAQFVELEVDTSDDGPSSVGCTTLTFANALDTIGDNLHIVCDGSKYYVTGRTKLDGAVTAA